MGERTGTDTRDSSRTFGRDPWRARGNRRHHGGRGSRALGRRSDRRVRDQRSRARPGQEQQPPCVSRYGPDSEDVLDLRRAAGHRRQEQHRVALRDGRVERLEVADVGVVEEHVDEPVEVAVAGEQLWREARIGRRRARRSTSRTVPPATSTCFWPPVAVRSTGGIRTTLIARATLRRRCSAAAGSARGPAVRLRRRLARRIEPEPDRVRRLEPVAGQQGDDLVVRRRSRHAGGRPAAAASVTPPAVSG